MRLGLAKCCGVTMWELIDPGLRYMRDSQYLHSIHTSESTWWTEMHKTSAREGIKKKSMGCLIKTKNLIHCSSVEIPVLKSWPQWPGQWQTFPGSGTTEAVCLKRELLNLVLAEKAIGYSQVSFFWKRSMLLAPILVVNPILPILGAILV